MIFILGNEKRLDEEISANDGSKERLNHEDDKEEKQLAEEELVDEVHHYL